MQRRPTSLLVIIFVIGLFISGYFIFQKQNWKNENLPTISDTKEGHPKLESVLYQLIKSDNTSKFANSNNLVVKDHQVQVLIVLNDEKYTLPDKFGVEETRYRNTIQARVYINKLLELADDPNIILISKPYQAVPGN